MSNLQSRSLTLLLPMLIFGILSGCASEKHPAVTLVAKEPPTLKSAPSPTQQPAVRMIEKSLGPAPGSEEDFILNTGDRVYFDFDQTTLTAAGREELRKQVDWLKKYPTVTIRIEGNADERGTREYNFALGGRRAEAVREFMMMHGILPTRMTSISYGKEKPIDPGSDDVAQSHNRNAHTAITGNAL